MPDRNASIIVRSVALKQTPLAGQRLENQHAQKHTEDEHHQENSQVNKEQYFRDAPRARGDVREAEKPGDHRDDEEYKSPLDHGWIPEVSLVPANIQGIPVASSSAYTQRRGAEDAKDAEEQKIE